MLYQFSDARLGLDARISLLVAVTHSSQPAFHLTYTQPRPSGTFHPTPASRLTWPVSLFGSGMEQGFDWKNLEQNKMPALKFICQQHSIRVNGKTKRDYVNAIAEYRNQQNRAFVPPPPRADQLPINPELQALTRTQRTHTLSDLHHAKTIQRFHDNERRLQMKITPNVFQQQKPVVPPTPPKPAQPINFLRQPIYNSRRSPPLGKHVDFAPQPSSSSSSSSSSVSREVSPSSYSSRYSSPGDFDLRDKPTRARVTRRLSSVVAVVIVMFFLLLLIL